MGPTGEPTSVGRLPGLEPKEENVSEIDWQGIPLDQFLSKTVRREDGTLESVMLPHGDSVAQSVMTGLEWRIGNAYEAVLTEEAMGRWEREGEVPVLRDGEWRHEDYQSFTLRDVPVVLDSLVELQKEHDRREREEAERHAARSKERKRVLAKERYKRKKLGEWNVGTDRESGTDEGANGGPNPFRWPPD